jgi:hypothetical protein
MLRNIVERLQGIVDELRELEKATNDCGVKQAALSTEMALAWISLVRDFAENASSNTPLSIFLRVKLSGRLTSRRTIGNMQFSVNEFLKTGSLNSANAVSVFFGNFTVALDVVAGHQREWRKPARTPPIYIKAAPRFGIPCTTLDPP